MIDLHKLALDMAEEMNPGAHHTIESIEIDGPPDEPGDAYITVHSIVTPSQFVNMIIRQAENPP